MQHLRRAAFAATLAGTFLLGGFILPDRDARGGADLFRDVLTLVSTRFVDTLEIGEVYERAAEGLVDRLDDPYAHLFTPEELEEFTVAYEGHYAGVGMMIESQQGSVVVRRVFPNTPAERNGVRIGDRVSRIDGESVDGWALEKVSNALKGEPGSKVQVRFTRYGVDDPLEVVITRAVVRIPAVPYATIVDGDVGYIPLQQFNETSAREVERSVQNLLRDGAKGLVLDLRGNGGGIVDQAVGIAGLFLPSGSAIALQSERGSDERVYRNEREPVAADVPLVVLIDGASASASEIVAGALQDHDRAVILGTTSFGKGQVQTAYRLDGGYVLKMTVGKWFTPSGRTIHRDREVVDGRLVEVDDSTHFAAGKAERPEYRSDGGRVVYGGGGIMPDLEVTSDTLSTGERALLQALLAHSQDYSIAVFDLASELQRGVRSDFEVTPEWRAELYHRLTERGVELDPQVWEGGASYIERELIYRVGQQAFGDAYVKTRVLDTDAQLVRAIDLIHSAGPDQGAMFGYVEDIRDAVRAGSSG